MNRFFGARGFRTSAISIVTLCAAFGLPSLAQEQDDIRGGVLLTFGVDQNVSLIENQSLAATSRGTTLRTTTDLSFGISSETQSTRLSADLTTALNGINRAGGRDGFELEAGDPRLTLRYLHRTVDTTIRARLSYSDRDVAFIDPLTDFRDEDGNLLFEEDFLVLNGLDISGTGNRQSLSYGASLEIFKDRPFGLTFSVDVADTDYVNSTTIAFIDNTRTTLGVVGRFDITPVTQLTLGLSREILDSTATTETDSLDANLTFARPDGSLGLGVTATDTQGGTRTELRFSRNYQLPRDVAIGATLGLTNPAASDDLYFTGTLSYARPLPNGSVNARLNRSFGTGSEGQEQVQTSLNLSALHALTPLATLGLEADYARVDETGSDTFSTIASLGATVTYDLSRDWQVEGAFTYETRDTNTTGLADRNTVSLTVSRDFTFRP